MQLSHIKDDKVYYKGNNSIHNRWIEIKGLQKELWFSSARTFFFFPPYSLCMSIDTRLNSIQHFHQVSRVNTGMSPRMTKTNTEERATTVTHSFGYTVTIGVRWLSHPCKRHWNAAFCSATHIFKIILKNWTGYRREPQTLLKRRIKFLIV